MTVKLFLIRESEKARQFCTNLKVGGNQAPRPIAPFWLPKSEITQQVKTLDGVVPVCRVTIPDWLGKKHGLEEESPWFVIE